MSAGTANEWLYWVAAITEWHESGDTEPIAQGLRDGLNIPPFAREHLADMVSGRAKRNPSLDAARRTTRNLFIRGNYAHFLRLAKDAKRRGLLRRGESPADVALQELASMYGLSEDSIHTIIRRKRV